MAGRKALKRKLPQINLRKKDRVSETHTIASIVLVVEVDLVDVHVELTVVITPGVEADTCEGSHLYHCRSNHTMVRERAEFYVGHRSPKTISTYKNLFYFKKINDRFKQTYPFKLCRYIYPMSSRYSRNRSEILHHKYIV